MGSSLPMLAANLESVLLQKSIKSAPVLCSGCVTGATVLPTRQE